MKRAWKTSTTPSTAGRQAETVREDREADSEAMQRTYKTPAAAGGHARTMNTEPIRFDTKIAVLLRADLEPWQRLNVTSFLVSGLGTQVPEVIGEPYEDADGVPYLPMFRQPVMVFEATKEVLATAHARALSRALPRALFTSDLFATGNDRDNRAAVRAVPTADLDLVGLAVYGPRNAVDKVVKGARMHP
ncbi:hypothetical protein GCM10010104_31910 [Streptomyces indiaensis]|uniref:DUF2000 domain-containing protein n=2 Tax=Streptomyces TaxID=1883 RepID=A0ABN3DKX3_9ACTN